MQDSHELRRGWLVIAGSFAGMFISGGAISTYVLGPITKPLQAEFDWSRSGISACQSLLALGITLGTPLFGWLADRSSARRVSLVSTVAFCACFASAAWLTGRLWQFQLVYFLCGFLGAGCGAVIYTRAIGAVFSKRRGIALGMTLSGAGATAFVAPILVNKLNEAFGWRSVFVGIASLVLLAGLPIVYLGLGSQEARVRDTPTRAPNSGGASRAEVLQDHRFYLLLLASIIFGLFAGSLIINFVPVLIERGVSPRQAAHVSAILGVAIVMGRLSIGTLLDRFNPANVGTAIFVVAAIGVLLFPIGGLACGIVALSTVGLTIGAELDIFSFIVLRYFGLRAYGAIFGMLFGGYTASSILGPVMGTMLLASHGYVVLFTTAAGGFAVIAALFLVLRFLAQPTSSGQPTSAAMNRLAP